MSLNLLQTKERVMLECRYAIFFLYPFCIINACVVRVWLRTHTLSRTEFWSSGKCWEKAAGCWWCMCVSLLRCMPPCDEHTCVKVSLVQVWEKGGIFRCHPYFKWVRATGLSNYNGLRWPHAAAREEEEGKDTTGEILLKMPTENGKRHTAEAAHKMCSAKNSIQFWQGLRQDRMK